MQITTMMERFFCTCLKRRSVWCCVLSCPLAEANVLQFWCNGSVSVCVCVCVYVCVCIHMCLCVGRGGMHVHVSTICVRKYTCLLVQTFLLRYLLQAWSVLSLPLPVSQLCGNRGKKRRAVALRNHMQNCCENVSSHIWLIHTFKVPSCLPAKQ